MTINEILQQEINRETKLIDTLRDNDKLDDISKQEIRNRVYDQYKYHQQMLELELA